jgi:hypothetical protein
MRLSEWFVIPQPKYLTNSNPSQVRPGRGVNEIKEYVCQSLLIHVPRLTGYLFAESQRQPAIKS